MTVADLRPLAIADPARAVEEAIELLDTGRPRMARAVLAVLQGRIRGAVDAACARARAEGARVLERAVEEARALRDAQALREGEAAEAARLRAEAKALASAMERQRAGLRALIAETEHRRAEAGRPRKAAAEARPALPKPHDALAAALREGRVTAERVAGLLRIRPADVGPLAAGRVGLPGSAWKRLLREIGA